MKLAAFCSFCLTLLSGFSPRAQNLVPNPDFELYNNCPVNLAAMPFSNDLTYFPTVLSWSNPVLLSSPDYLAGCATPASQLQVPNTLFGYQQATSGSAYAGIIAFQGQWQVGSLIYDYREYLQARLLQPLKAGSQYCVRFFVSPTISPSFHFNYIAIDEIGINFSKQRQIDTLHNNLSLPYSVRSTPGVYFADTSKWYVVEGVYTASGGEEWLTLGTFKNANPPAFQQIWPQTPNLAQTFWNYLFIDDVSVVEMTSADTILRSADTFVCKTGGLGILLQGNPLASSYLWQNGATAAQITANDTGLYWCTARQGCQLIADTFHIRYAATKVLSLGPDTFNCLSQPMHIGANHPYASYLWNTGATTPDITVSQSGTYILTISDTCGVQVDTISVAIQDPTPPPVVHDTTVCQFAAPPKLNVSGSRLTWWFPGISTGFAVQPYIETSQTGVQRFFVSQTVGHCQSPRVPVDVTIRYTPSASIGDWFSFCDEADTLLGESIPDVQYRWNTGEDVCCIRPRQTGWYAVTLSNPCGSATDSAFVEVTACDECLVVPTAFSPNNDNKNDVFVPIVRCDVYNYLLRIYNRWGELVFASNDVRKGWHGDQGGVKADLGVYVFLLEYNSSHTHSRKQIRGNLTLIR